MEWLWAGGKGQMRPFPRSQLPSQLPIVSHPLPTQRPSVISVRPRLQREPGRARVLLGLLVSGQVGRLEVGWGGLHEGRKEGGGEARRGVSESINHGPLRSCLTHFSNELSAKPLIN